MVAAVADVSARVPDQSGVVIDEAAVWVEANRATIPPAVYDCIALLLQFRRELEQTKLRAGRLLSALRLALGITPKSERGTIAIVPPQTDEERLVKLRARRSKLAAEIRRYEDRLGKGRKKRQKVSKSGELATKPEMMFAFSGENVFSGNLAEHHENTHRLVVNKVDNFENPKGLHSSDDDRTRREFAVTTRTINLKVETVTDPRTGKSVTASTDHIGPPNSQATWVGVANTIIAVIGYAIPINRLARMLKDSSPYFTSSRLCFYLKMAAELFEPIYTCLGEQLSDSDVLQGDDTKARVLEVNKALKNGGTLRDPPEGSLIAKVADIFGRVFDKKRGKGTKRALNVSVVIGKIIATDPRSYVYFFRTHLGSLGDLLSQMFELRDPKKKDVTIISDLATTNTVAALLYKKFTITHAGCAAHARRPFWQKKDQDERLCYWMLSAFLILEQIEDRIDELGRTSARIVRYRQRYSQKIWAAILKRCQAVMRGETVYGHYWPKTSELYGACAYIVSHYKKLTRYLDDPRLFSNNNLSERVLRWDKIMQDSSKFRATEAGRLQVDILRTIVHTCSAAKVELKDYLVFVFLNRAAVQKDPRQFTPHAYGLKIAADKASVQQSVTN